MAEILGLNAIADNLLKEPDLIQKVKARGQVIFTWTDDKNDRETVALLKKLGVDGIIYDRLDDMTGANLVLEALSLFSRTEA